LSMRRRAQGVQSKFSRTLPKVISRHVNVRLARAKSTKIVCRVTRQRGSIRAVDVYKIRRSKWIDAKRIEARRRWFKPTRRKEGPIPKFKAGFCLRYLQHHKFRLRARFVRLYTRILNFLNFVDRYWATFFRFFDFPVKFVAVRRNLYRFIRRWSKLRLPRRLSRIRSNRIIFRDFRMIQGRVGFQFSRVFHGLIRLYSHPTDFEYDILRLIAGVNIISACVSRSRAYGRLAIRNSLNFCRNYWYLVISTFWFRKQAYATAMISGCEIPVILRRLNCLIFTSSRISSLLMFSDYGAKLPLRVPKFYKFVGNYTRPPSRGLWEFCFVRPIRVNKI
jgi:hypothetical protein